MGLVTGVLYLRGIVSKPHLAAPREAGSCRGEIERTHPTHICNLSYPHPVAGLLDVLTYIHGLASRLFDAASVPHIHVHTPKTSLIAFWCSCASLCPACIILCTYSENFANRVLVLVRLAKVLGPSTIQRARGSQVILRTETSLSSCSTVMAGEAFASYSWSLLAANESRAGEQDVAVEVGRDPRVLVIPPYMLGFAGSSYLFQFRSAFRGETAATANATGEDSTFQWCLN